MRKTVLGSSMILTGVLSIALILCGTLASGMTVNGQYSAMWIISQYGLMPAMYIFAGIAAAGLLIALWGLLKKKKSDS